MADKEWQREWRKKNRAKLSAYLRSWRQTTAGRQFRRLKDAERRMKIREMIREAKDVPCVDCGLELIPELMELDHVHGPRGKWHANSISQTKKELDKCEVRCPLCHKIRHWIKRMEES